MSNIEILPPALTDVAESDRRSDGRWKTGHSGNPNGRPSGATGEHTKAIKDMVKEALTMVGGSQYLAMCAITQPAAFLGLVGKTMPMKLTDDADGEVAIVVARRVLVQDVPPGAND